MRVLVVEESDVPVPIWCSECGEHRYCITVGHGATLCTQCLIDSLCMLQTAIGKNVKIKITEARKPTGKKR